MSHLISDDVRRFVLTCIPSVPYLEAALLFHGEPGRAWSAVDVASALYIQERESAQILQTLCDIGLLRPVDGRFMYHPKDDAMAAVFANVAAAYRGNLIEMTNLIHDQTQKNAVRFADAFKFRKDV